MKDYIIPLCIAISIVLFISFLLGLERYVNPRPPGISYSIGLRIHHNDSIGLGSHDKDSIEVLVYQQPDSVPKKKETAKTPVKQKPGEITIKLPEQKLVASDSVKYGAKTIAFNRNPKLMLWILTFSLMIAVSFALGAGFVGQIFTLFSIYKITKQQWIANVILAAIFVAALIYFNVNGDRDRTFLPPFDIIFDLNAMFNREVFCWWIWPGVIFSFTVGGLALLGTLLVNSVVGNKAAKKSARQQVKESEKLNKETYQILKSDLERYLAGFSILIVFAILTISFLNQAMIAHFINIEKLQIIRSEFIYAYGFIFSSVLALIYIPINQRLRSITEPGAFDDAGKEKNMFHNNFLSLLSILAPLVSSGISEMIKAFS